MVRYGMVWYGMVWYGIQAEVGKELTLHDVVFYFHVNFSYFLLNDYGAEAKTPIPLTM